VPRLAARVAHGEANAFVLAVREEMHDAAAPVVDVDLDRVVGGVAEQPRGVALVRGSIVERGIGKGEDGCDATWWSCLRVCGADEKLDTGYV
jgi:hypothetical protein